MGDVQAFLQKMKQHAGVLQTQLICRAKFSVAEGVLVELLAAAVKQAVASASLQMLAAALGAMAK